MPATIGVYLGFTVTNASTKLPCTKKPRRANGRSAGWGKVLSSKEGELGPELSNFGQYVYSRGAILT